MLWSITYGNKVNHGFKRIALCHVKITYSKLTGESEMPTCCVVNGPTFFFLTNVNWIISLFGWLVGLFCLVFCLSCHFNRLCLIMLYFLSDGWFPKLHQYVHGLCEWICKTCSGLIVFSVLTTLEAHPETFFSIIRDTCNWPQIYSPAREHSRTYSQGHWDLSSA